MRGQGTGGSSVGPGLRPPRRRPSEPAGRAGVRSRTRAEPGSAHVTAPPAAGRAAAPGVLLSRRCPPPRLLRPAPQSRIPSRRRSHRRGHDGKASARAQGRAWRAEPPARPCGALGAKRHFNPAWASGWSLLRCGPGCAPSGLPAPPLLEFLGAGRAWARAGGRNPSRAGGVRRGRGRVGRLTPLQPAVR